MNTEKPTVSKRRDSDEVIVTLPSITHLDTAVWSVEVGLTREDLVLLRDAIVSHLDGNEAAGLADRLRSFPAHEAPVYGDRSVGFQMGWDAARAAVLSIVNGESA